MDVKGEVLLELFNKSKIRNVTKTYTSRAKIVLYLQSNLRN